MKQIRWALWLAQLIVRRQFPGHSAPEDLTQQNSLENLSELRRKSKFGEEYCSATKLTKIKNYHHTFCWQDVKNVHSCWWECKLVKLQERNLTIYYKTTYTLAFWTKNVTSRNLRWRYTYNIYTYIERDRETESVCIYLQIYIYDIIPIYLHSLHHY